MTNYDEERPNPELLLEAIKRQESKKGHLKIFLGMAAGVGKTYAMLEAAQNRRHEGIDVYVGSIETHGREETSHLLEGLRIIPEKWINYKDTVFEELDLDEILKFQPQLVIIDELAHNNVPGSRHPKRWQDVVEILDKGIDVYTTLNVQHIESLKDVIENIAGIQIRETVPDVIVESASSIELIDLTPEELLQRLREGKVYFEEQSVIAAQNFFQEDRLTALREIVLRYAAEKIDHDLHGMVSTVERKEGWKPRERLLVAVSHSPFSQKLIRTTRRLAFNLNAPWIAVNVNDGSVLDEKDNEMLAKNLDLARNLGAEVITTNDPDIVEAIQRISRRKGVTQIIIGRTPGSSFFSIFKKFTMLDKLAKECSNIDIHVIRQAGSRAKLYRKRFPRPKDQIFNYLLILGLVGLFSLLNWFALPLIGYKIVGSIFLVSILFLSLYFRKGPLIFASLLYALIWDYFFIPPVESFVIASNEDTALLLLYFIAAVITGILIDRERSHKELFSQREQTTQALYEIMRGIAGAPTTEEVFKSVKERLSTVLNGTCEIVVKLIDNGLNFEDYPLLLDDEKERNAAIWVFENGKEAGWSTSTLPLTRNLYIPLKGYNENVGVLAYRPKKPKELSTEEKNLLHTVAQQLANHLERTFSEERRREVQHVTQIEKVYQTVLKLISNQFQQPLVSIQEAVKELKEQKGGLSRIRKIEVFSKELIHVFDNISAMAKLSSGVMPINISPHNIQDVITNCTENLKRTIGKHSLKISIQGNLPPVNFDFSLVQLLLFNILSNACEYSPPESTIEIEAELSNGYLMLSVSDEGKGIPPELLDIVFEKFYRLPGTSEPGMGLGLSIAKTVAEIHHGHLLALNRDGGGTKFSFCLPTNLEPTVRKK